MDNDLNHVKRSIGWPLIFQSVGWEVGKNGGQKGNARCQKHGPDKTPSLSWNEEKGFYCHDCAIGGDKLHFLMGVMNCDFYRGRKHLYQLAGVPLLHYN